MPDISMCKGGNCTLKYQCYRYIADPNPHRQSYFAEPPYVEKFTGSSCDHFWEPQHLAIKEGRVMKKRFIVYWSFAHGTPKEGQASKSVYAYSEADASAAVANENHLIWVHSVEEE